MAQRKRTNFSENQKAAIYARDHATCAFSGISLWIFDYGIRPNYEMDWADHIKPSAKGGTSSLENGVCASHTFNSKKKDNGSDNVFFFQNGKITPAYILSFGFASNELVNDLERRSRLERNDWFLNRSIVNIYIVFDYRCSLEFQNINYKRDDTYWLGCAYKRYCKWHRRRENQTLDERGLIKDIRPFGIDSLTEVELVASEAQFHEITSTFFRTFFSGNRLYPHTGDTGIH